VKGKFSKILGVALPLVMVLALTVALVPANTPTVEAATAAPRFTNIPIPKIGADGKYVMTPGTDVGPIAMSSDSSVLFAAANVTAGTSLSDLLKSTDGGYTWTKQTTFTSMGSIRGIGVSPEYGVDTTLFVATDNVVYQSVDGAKTFSAMNRPTGWGATETINDMDVALDAGGRLSVIIGTRTSATTGEVYVYSPATTGMNWQAQGADGSAGPNYTKTRQALAVAFSPNFANDEGIFAITVGAAEATRVKCSFGYTNDGAGWGASIGNGKFYDTVNGTAQITAAGARLAFPGDFDVDSLSSNVAYVGLRMGPGNGYGDAYKVVFQPTLSSTLDLNVRGLLGTQRTGTNVYSIDATGDSAATNIIVGTDMWSTAIQNYYWLTYYSADSGETWMTPRESQPTGGTLAWTNSLLSSGAGANCEVMLGPDYTESGMAYASTQGLWTAGFSRTTDGCKSWNQLSLVDYAYNPGTASSGNHTYRVSEMDTAGPTKWWHRYETNAGTYDSYWLTTSGGSRYERTFSYATASMPQDFDGLDRKGAKKDVFFLTKKSMAKFWRSTDSGDTWPRTITAKSAINKYYFDGDGLGIHTLHTGGKLWDTTNLGRPWTEPEESILSGTLASRTSKGDIMLIGSYAGGSPYNKAFTAYVSLDGGNTFLHRLPSGPVYCGLTWDANFAETKYIYAFVFSANGATGNGIWRLKFNEDDPESGDWEQIDTNSTGWSSVNIALGPNWIHGGTMLVYDQSTVNTTAGSPEMGGFWRCTNPSADIDGNDKPLFLHASTGLLDGDSVAYLGMFPPKKTYYFKNGAIKDNIASHARPYYKQALVFTDTMQKGPALVAPADGAMDAGLMLNTTELTLSVPISWATVSGATSYQYQVARDASFAAPITASSGYTAGTEVTIEGLVVGQTYYWRARVAMAGPAGAPLISGWSTARSFTIGTPVTTTSRVFEISGPEVGSSDVSVQPTFVWSEYSGAINYEIMLSEDKDFAIPEWSHTVTDTFYKAEETLAYDTTYYWRVRGVTGPPPTGKGAKGPAPGGPWATGIITTEAAPVEETPPVITVTEPAKPPEVKVVEVPIQQAAPIPTALLVAIIAIGAVLVIALIVLIVRTRRVA